MDRYFRGLVTGIGVRQLSAATQAAIRFYAFQVIAHAGRTAICPLAKPVDREGLLGYYSELVFFRV